MHTHAKNQHNIPLMECEYTFKPHIPLTMTLQSAFTHFQSALDRLFYSDPVPGFPLLLLEHFNLGRHV